MPRSPTPSASPRTTTPQPDSRHGRSKSSDARIGKTPIIFLPGQDNSDQDARRPSVQFASPSRSPAASPSPARQSPRRALSYQPSGRNGRRMSSPPPPPLFQPRVSFDTFDNKEASDFSLTLQSKHKDYEYSKRSRTFLCGTDTNDYSEFALEWLIDELVDDGDEIVCLRVVEKDSKFAGDSSIEEGRYRAEAEKMMSHIQGKNVDNKAVNIIMEFSVGKIQDTIQSMIRIYEPAILVVGTRGRSLGGFQGLLPGSVSKWCLQHSPVPVIVVRPSAKRDKKKRKRLQDPTRRGYKDILDRSSGGDGGGGSGGVGSSSTNALSSNLRHIVDASIGDDEHAVEATNAEQAAVLAAIGYNPSPEFEELAAEMQRTQSAGAKSDDGTNLSELSSPNDLKSPGVVMKSPELLNLESPALSEASSEGEEEDEEEEGGAMIEAVPGHVLLAQDEANAKAREEEKQGESVGRDAATEIKTEGEPAAETPELTENIKPERDKSPEGTEGHKADKE
ncbi:hypothetical protein EV356DRAFT_498961 [Viridothelium virens]|uniref:UspA domain-containing protein n=1 Tax=Viridothelium virens TaxID=1048519 RepID=A0A6A6HDZ3_VIRVR|nr:hypothetical protein EV356DRAFT_498961 [Viridothelium virens]